MRVRARLPACAALRQQVIQNAATVNISITIRYVLQILGSIVVIFVLSWSLTLIMLVRAAIRGGV